MSAESGPGLATVVGDAIRSHMAAALDGTRLDVRYVVNRGGFVNASFHVTDGTRAVHVKVARDAETVSGLRRWHAVASRLSDRYLAPRVLGILRFSDALEATVFEHVPGAPPRSASGTWLARVSEALTRLHADGELARRLGGEGRPSHHTWYATFQERFEADLADLRARIPPFVAPPLFAVLETLVGRFRNEVDADPAFQPPSSSPVHADIWRDNVLVSPSGHVTILDWDDLTVGDPALDWGILTGFHGAGDADATDAAPRIPSLAPDTERRAALYRRATVLDAAIDSLSDWVAAAEVPDVMADARAHAERVHRAAVSELVRAGLVPPALARPTAGDHLPR